MNTLIFAAGIVLGALVTFAFIFIVAAISNNKSKSSKLDNDLLKELWREYMKEMKDENDRNNSIQ